MKLAPLALACLLISCDKPPHDTAPAGDDSEPEQGTDGGTTDGGCQEVTVDYDGPDEPVVGDVWTLLPKCDGALVLGTTVIRVEPAEAATLDENVLTFQQSGLCTISIQVGSEIGYLDVEVGEAG